MTIRYRLSLAAFALAATFAAAAWALNPGADTRQGLLDATRVCVGGGNDGNACIAQSGCPGGSCELTNVAPDVDPVRGFLTVIADKDSQDWDDASSIPLTTDSCGNPAPTDTSRSTFTMLLEFRVAGELFTFAETYRALDGTCPCGTFCLDDWTQQPVESQFANDIAILWGQLPPAAESAIIAALGPSATGKVPYLDSVDEVPICTNLAACNDAVFSDHSAATDILASVRRYKVTIRAVDPLLP